MSATTYVRYQAAQDERFRRLLSAWLATLPAGQVFGGVVAAGQPGQPGAHRVPVPLDQGGERRPVAGPRPPHALLFPVVLHVSRPSCHPDRCAGSLLVRKNFIAENRARRFYARAGHTTPRVTGRVRTG